MTTAERIEQIAKAAAQCGQPLKSIVVKKGEIAITYMPPASEDDGEGLNKDWRPKR